MHYIPKEAGKAADRIKRLSFFILAVLFILMLTACENSLIRERGERGALVYYQNKYGEDIDIVSSREWGSTTAILPAKINQMLFEMSDGTTVLWDRKTEQYADTRQAEEILRELREELLRPYTDDALGAEIIASDYTSTAAVFEDYAAVCGRSVFSEYFDGNIRGFAEAEKPILMDYNVVMREPSDDDEQGTVFKAQAENLRLKLQPYFSGQDGRIYVLSRDYTGELVPYRQIISPEGNRFVRGIGRLDFGSSVHWIENVYIEAMPGVWVTSSEEDFVLQTGDIVMEQAGTGADLQEMLDARYEALPMEAEENKDSIYRFPDKKHCSKTVVSNKETPVYRIRWSDRARAAQGPYGIMDVCIYMDPETEEAGETLWYFPESEESAFEMYPVATGAISPDIGEYCQLINGALYYFGEVDREDYFKEND